MLFLTSMSLESLEESGADDVWGMNNSFNGFISSGKIWFKTLETMCYFFRISHSHNLRKIPMFGEMVIPPFIGSWNVLGFSSPNFLHSTTVSFGGIEY